MTTTINKTANVSIKTCDQDSFDQDSFDQRVKKTLLTQPEVLSKLTQASIYFSQGYHDKAEPLFRSIPEDFSQYHIAVSGLFNLLWLKEDTQSKLEAMHLLDQYLAKANREDPEVKPVIANFLKIKIDLLKKDQWLKF